MSFLSSLGKAASAAAASVSSMVSGTNLPFETGAEFTSVRGKMPWKMHAGTKDGADVSIFLYDLKEKKSEAELAQVRNAMRRLRTIKHPYLLKCLDAGESTDNKGGGVIYIVTEPVQPLCEVIEALQATPGGIAWGIYTLAAAVKFLNMDCNIIHGQVCMPSLFVDKGMDWKLGGFELLTEANGADEGYFSSAKETLPRFYQSPELGRGQVDVLKRIPVAADWWALGCTVYEVFCGAIKSFADLKNLSDMPHVLQEDFKRMLSSNPQSRLRPAELLANPIFEEEYVSLQLFLETLNVKDSVEKDRFFSKLAERVPNLPKPAAQWKVLPALNNSLEYGGGSARALEPLLKIAAVLNEEEYQQQVVPTVVKLFSNTDRQMRIPLLERLPMMVEHLSMKTINDQIFQHISMGFSDTSPVLREMTVKAIVPLAAKLRPATMGLVMRAFAKLQLDEEAAIRTNTTICLGKIASHIDASTREKVLIPACCRALKDPFPPGRGAGLMSLTATQQYHKAMDVATKIPPNVAPTLLDPEREVRETALQCLRVYVSRLEAASKQVGIAQQAAQQGGEAGSAGVVPAEVVGEDISKAADKVLDSMSWLTSKVVSATKEAVSNSGGGGGGGGGGAAPGAAGGGAGPAGSPAGVGPSAAAAYKPPAPSAVPAAPMAASAASQPALGGSSGSLDGWGGDDGLNDAFSMPAPTSAPMGASLGSPLGASLGSPLGAPMGSSMSAPMAAPMPAAGAGAGLAPTAGKGLQLGGGAAVASGSTPAVNVNDIFASMATPSAMPPAAPSAPMAQSAASKDPFASLGMAAAPPPKPAQPTIAAPMVPQKSGVAMNPAAAGSAAFGDLDPLAMLAKGGAPKKPAATKAASSDWDSW